MLIVRAWWAATRGNVGVAFALVVIPLCAVLGLAIDYLRASNLHNALQAAVDSAALAAGAQGSADEATLRRTAASYLDANLNVSEKAALGDVEVTFPQPGTIRVDAKAISQNSFLKLAGIAVTPVAVASEAMIADKLEVALVLDNTGSMAGAKETALRQAAQELVEAVMIDQGDVKVAVVPFSQYVNVGVQNRAASWLKIGTISATETWTGCVRSRLQPLDLSDRSPQVPYPILTQETSVALNRFCPGPLTPLTADKSVALAAVTGMAMSGDTYIPAGLMWGWNVLSPDPPFTEAKANGVRKAMVLMTDGQNNRSNFAYGFHDGKDITAAVTAMLTLCTNIKQAGIHLYTVAFAISAAERQVIPQLRDCASDSASAFNADDGTALIQAFSDITRQLQRLRLSE